MKSTVFLLALMASFSTLALDQDSSYQTNIGGAMIVSDASNSDFTGATGFKIIGGATLYGYFGIEIAYSDMGTFTYKPTDSAVDISQQTEVATLLFLPMDEVFKPYLKIGHASWKAVSTENTLNGKLETDLSGSDIFFGLGVKIGGRFKAFSLELAKYNFSDDDYIDESATTSFSIGFEKRFF